MAFVIPLNIPNAPNFAAVNSLMAQAAQTQQQGFKTLQDTLKGTQTAIRDRNTEQLMSQLNQAKTLDQFNDAGFQQQLNNQLASLNGEYHSKDFQKTLEARPDQLTTRGINQVQLTNALNLQHDNPVISQILAKRLQDPNADVSDLLEQLKGGQADTLLKLDGLKTSALGRQQVNHSMTLADKEYGLKSQQYKDQQKYRELALQELGLGGNTAGDGSSANSTPMNMGDLQGQAVKAMQEFGWNNNVIAGFMGNFEVEGGWKGAKGDNGSAHGIAQWRGPRKDNFVKMFGKEPSSASIAEQMQFVQWELQNPAQAGMKKEWADQILNASSPQEAALLIDKYYERSSGTARDKRQEIAGRYFSTLGGGQSQQAAPQQYDIPPTLARPTQLAQPAASSIVQSPDVQKILNAAQKGQMEIANNSNQEVIKASLSNSPLLAHAGKNGSNLDEWFKAAGGAFKDLHSTDKANIAHVIKNGKFTKDLPPAQQVSLANDLAQLAENAKGRWGKAFTIDELSNMAESKVREFNALRETRDANDQHLIQQNMEQQLMLHQLQQAQKQQEKRIALLRSLGGI